MTPKPHPKTLDDLLANERPKIAAHLCSDFYFSVCVCADLEYFFARAAWGKFL
jgi:hypothetical protein